MGVAVRLELSRAAVTRRVDGLEAAGWVTRERTLDDRRGMEAVLTPAGRERMRRADPVCCATIAECFTDPLGANGTAGVARACDRLLASHPRR